jgi:endonuclease/exonuclease/phosphatase family metal-dependent hydrolase
MRQLAYVSCLARKYENVIIMGDMNCKSDSLEMKVLQKEANLREPTHDLHTFPSWRPERNIDHILVSPTLKVEKVQVLNHTYSDHLPIEMEVIIPSSVKLTA